MTTYADVLEFVRHHSLAVQASVSPLWSARWQEWLASSPPMISNCFSTPWESTRKVTNLRQNSMIAFVIGGLANGEERTVQYEGVVDEPIGPELDQLKEQYFVRFPDGRDRQSWPGITYRRARPRWLRFSNVTTTPPKIAELTFRLSG